MRCAQGNKYHFYYSIPQCLSLISFPLKYIVLFFSVSLFSSLFPLHYCFIPFLLRLFFSQKSVYVFVSHCNCFCFVDKKLFNSRKYQSDSQQLLLLKVCLSLSTSFLFVSSTKTGKINYSFCCCCCYYLCKLL